LAAKERVFRLTLPSNPKLIHRVELYLKKINRVAHLDEIQMHKLMVSLTEAVNNAIIHGNKSDISKKVRVRCDVTPGGLMFIVEDQGKGFTLDKIKNPLSDQNLLMENGRGVFLMRTLMDRVEFRTGKNGSQVVLWLNLNKN
jgi:serine/threonine-protein kinase RsbW